MTAAKDLRREALALSREERSGLARDLIESLEAGRDDDAEQAWLDEAEHRAADLSAGEVVNEAWEDVRDRIAEKLRSLRP
jgi:putative addiction module component (TIGR02574 family)